MQFLRGFAPYGLMLVNLKTTFPGMPHEARAMLTAGNGDAIVKVRSVNAFFGFATAAAYRASTHGLIGLATTVSAEPGSQGVRVNPVCPGIVYRPMEHRARRSAAGDRRSHGLPVLGRGQVHYRYHAYAGRG